MNLLASSFNSVGGGVSTVPPLDEPEELEVDDVVDPDEVEEVVPPEELEDDEGSPLVPLLLPPCPGSPGSGPPVHAAATRRMPMIPVDTTRCPSSWRSIVRWYCGSAASAPGCVA